MKAPVLIVNPASGAGRTRRRLADLEAAAKHVFGHADVRPTQQSGDATSLTVALWLAGHADNEGFEDGDQYP